MSELQRTGFLQKWALADCYQASPRGVHPCSVTYWPFPFSQTTQRGTGFMSDLLVNIRAWPRTSRLATPLLLPAQWIGWEEVSGEGLASSTPPFLPFSKPMS